MIISKNSKFALVGHGFSLFHLFNEIVKKKLTRPIIITHEKKYHLRDLRENKNDISLYRDISTLQKKTKIYYVKNFNYNTVKDILKKNKIDYIFSCHSRFIFKKDIINIFKNKIFNIHSSLLPEERAGSYSYRIFNAQYFCASTIHMVEQGVDTGKILLQTKKIKISKSSIPYNFLVQSCKCALTLIKKFVNNVSHNKKFNVKFQNHEKFTYLPRFYTDIMGAIDWNWNGRFIDQFIKGCSKPYSGAFCYIIFKEKKYKVKIFNSKFFKTKSNHPVLNGKIFFQNNKIIKVYVNDGYIIIKLSDISLEKKILLKNFFGKTFFNNSDELLKAKILIPNVFKYK